MIDSGKEWLRPDNSVGDLTYFIVKLASDFTKWSLSLLCLEYCTAYLKVVVFGQNVQGIALPNFSAIVCCLH